MSNAYIRTDIKWAVSDKTGQLRYEGDLG